MAIIISLLTVLFMLELFIPEMSIKYSSSQNKTIDIFFVASLFIIFEIPLLLYAKNAIIKQRNEAITSESNKSLMIANLSHEIRTPMNAILGFTELLDQPDITQEEHKSYLEIIGQNGKVLLNLLNNIIHHSKLENHMVEPSFSTVSAHDSLLQVYNTLLPSVLEKPNLKLSLESFDKANGTLQTDYTILYQILINLTYNAVKFTNEGTVTLSYKDTPGSIMFIVKDTGCGIKDSLKPQIFSRFRKGTAEEEPMPMMGAGLGLSICKGLTQVLGGEIWFESEEKVGSTFYLSLPKQK